MKRRTFIKRSFQATMAILFGRHVDLVISVPEPAEPKPEPKQGGITIPFAIGGGGTNKVHFPIIKDG